MAALKHRACWLALCVCDPSTGQEGCHKIVQELPQSERLAVELALKKRSDPEHYDRELVLRVKRLGPEAVTEQEVDEVLGCL